MAGIGQGDAAPVAKEQRLFQVRFQATDLLADGRLGQVQFVGSLVKTAQPRRRFKAA